MYQKVKIHRYKSSSRLCYYPSQIGVLFLKYKKWYLNILQNSPEQIRQNHKSEGQYDLLIQKGNKYITKCCFPGILLIQLCSLKGHLPVAYPEDKFFFAILFFLSFSPVFCHCFNEQQLGSYNFFPYILLFF